MTRAGQRRLVVMRRRSGVWCLTVGPDRVRAPAREEAQSLRRRGARLRVVHAQELSVVVREMHRLVGEGEVAHQRVPQAMFYNGGLVYSAFSTVTYAAGDVSPAGGDYAAPGGTVYEIGHSRIYYPQGDDWGTARRAHFVSLDAHAEVYACGPPPMLEAVRALCAAREVPAQLALESGMACGYGACFGCVVATTDGYIRLCVDGPVIDAARLETALTPGAGH